MWSTLLLGLLSATAAQGGRDVSQTAVNCPTRCHCQRNTITCRNLNLTDTDLLLQISDQFYPDLDTLVIEGNEFGELEASNLFGPSVHHHRLTSLSLARNRIKLIHAKAFHAVKNLEVLDLSENVIGDIQGDVLAQMPNLVELRLRSAFARTDDSRQVAHLLHKLLFQTKSANAKLSILDLTDNNIQYLSPELICKLPGLETLILGNNFLRGFELSQPRCAPSLKSLDLSNNQISSLSANFTEQMDWALHLQRLNLSLNPFNCDCYLRPFVAWAKAQTGLLVDAEKTHCLDALPASLTQSPIRSLDEEALECPQSGSGPSGGVVFLLLCLGGVSLGLGAYAWRGKASRRLCPLKLPTRPLAAPSFRRLSQGYQELGKEKDPSQPPPPEFV